MDIFTFGLSIYHLFSGKQHSFENDVIQLETPSPVFQHLIEKCIDDDPEKRPTALELEKLFRIHYRMLMEVIEKVPNYTKLDKQDKFDLFVQIHNLVRDKLVTSE